MSKKRRQHSAELKTRVALERHRAGARPCGEVPGASSAGEAMEEGTAGAVARGTLGLVTQHPALFRRVRGRCGGPWSNAFPTIHFLDEQERIVVLAVYHVARDPRRLGERG